MTEHRNIHRLRAGRLACVLLGSVAWLPVGYRDDAGTRAVNICRAAEFDLCDDIGSARVRGQPVILAGMPRVLDPEQLAVALTDPDVERLLLSEGLSVVDIVTARDLRAYERLLLPDAPAYVCGLATREISADGTAGGFRQAPTRLVIGPPQSGPPLIVADCHREHLLSEATVRLG